MSKKFILFVDWIGRILTIKEIIIILGGSGMITAFISSLIPTIQSMPLVSQVFLDAGVFCLLVGITTSIWVRFRQKSLRDIPDILYKMHKRLTILAKQEANNRPIDINVIGNDYLELLGMDDLKYPELKQITKTSDATNDRKILQVVLNKFIEQYTEMDEVRLLLIRIGGLLTFKNIGLVKIRDNDAEYIKLNKYLIQLRAKIFNEQNTAIENYLQFSLGLNTIQLLLSSLPITRVDVFLPAIIRAEFGAFGQRTDIAMNELLAEVTTIVQIKGK